MITKHTAKLYRLNDYLGKWKKSFVLEDNVIGSVLTMSTNDTTGEMEILQTNDGGEEIKSRFSKVDCSTFYTALQKHLEHKV